MNSSYNKYYSELRSVDSAIISAIATTIDNTICDNTTRMPWLYSLIQFLIFLIVIPLSRTSTVNQDWVIVTFINWGLGLVPTIDSRSEALNVVYAIIVN